MIQTGSPRWPGGLGWLSRRRVGRGRRGRLGFGEDLGDVEEMTLARVVGKALAAPAEEVAAEQGQGLGQLVVLLLQLLVIRRGLLEHAFEFVDPALGVFGLLSGGLGLLVPVVLFEQMLEFIDAALGVFGLLPQLVVAAEQVVEQPRAWTRIVRQAWCDAHHTNYTRSFMLCKSSSDDFRHLPGLGRGAGTACVAAQLRRSMPERSMASCAGGISIPSPVATGGIWKEPVSSRLYQMARPSRSK